MRSALRNLANVTSRPTAGWLTLLLLVAVLVPSVCLIWFMKQAMRNEQLAGRQVLMEAAHANLALAQGGIKNWFDALARNVETNRAVPTNLVDALISFDVSSNVIIPVPEHPAAASPEGLALQDKARNLQRAGKKQDAAKIIIDAVGQSHLDDAVDEHGRSILASLELLALESTNSPTLLQKLSNQLNDYSRPMPAAQRRFLMRRLKELFPAQAAFPTLAAEDLAVRYLETTPEPARDGALKPTALSNIWQWAPGSGRNVVLFEADKLLSRLNEAVNTVGSSSVNLAVAPPARTSPAFLLTVSPGENLPGWQLGASLKDGNSLNTAGRAQVAFYVWVGVLTMAVVVALAILGAGLIRRQAAVAQLRNDLLANVTHELKTPLSSMRLLVDTLLQSKPLNEETARQYLELIATENLRLSRLIDNFLTFSRIERNKITFDFATVAPGDIAERAAAAMREKLSAGGCAFDLRVAGTLPPVAADADAMVTVLLNLLDNAWKYSGDEKQIALSVGAENGSVVFAVKDNGIGLSPRETKRIFKRFYQVDQRLARTGGGCGLGLSIVQFIVNAHRGAIRVESEPDRGSTFFVTLPTS